MIDTLRLMFAHALTVTMVLCHAGIAGADADDPEPQRPSGGHFTFYLDNDLFGGTDRDYTNGVRASWISEGTPVFGFMPARRQLEKLAGVDGGYQWVSRLSGFAPDSVAKGQVELNYGLSLTQLMFTPDDFATASQPPGQRRYAGYLGLGFSVHAKDIRALNSVELILGTTGPRSYAEDTQDFIHDLRDIEEFQGWHNQIPNEYTVDLSFTQKRRLRFLESRASIGAGNRFSIDGFAEWNARLGTFRTLASGGGLFRAGFNLPADYSDPRLSSTAYSHKFFEVDQRRQPDWSAYALFGANLSAIVHDATLDGPLFNDFETGNTREPFVGETYLGFGLRWKALELSYVQTYRSQTYDEQDGPADFGSVALRVRL